MTGITSDSGDYHNLNVYRDGKSVSIDVSGIGDDINGFDFEDSFRLKAYQARIIAYRMLEIAEAIDNEDEYEHETNDE